MGETAVYGLSSVVGRLLNYLLVPLHTSVFATSEYGIYGYLYSYIGLLMVLLTYGFETAFFRFTQENADRSKAFGTAVGSFLISTVIFLVIFILFNQPIASLIKIPQHPEYIIWFALIIAFDVLVAIPFARLRLQGKAFQFAGIKILSIVINIGFNLFFLLLCPYLLKHQIATDIINKIYNPSIGIGYIFIANLLASAATFLVFLPTFLKEKINFDKALWKKMFRYAAPLIVVGLAAMVNELLDRILLKFCLTGSEDYINSQIGIYSACYKLAVLMALFTQAYRMAAEPFFFSESKQQDAKQKFAQLMNYFVFFAGLIFLGVTFFIDWFKFFISNEAYWVGLPVVPILLMAYFFLGVYFNLSVWYKLTDKTIYAAFISIIGAFITVVMNLLLIPKIGFYGSAWTTLLVYVCMTIMSFQLGQKHYKIPYNLKSLGTIFTMAIMFYFLMDFVVEPNTNVVVTYLSKVLLLLAYCAIGYSIFFAKKSEPTLQ